jgi:hypothetical protein
MPIMLHYNGWTNISAKDTGQGDLVRTGADGSDGMKKDEI